MLPIHPGAGGLDSPGSQLSKVLGGAPMGSPLREVPVAKVLRTALLLDHPSSSLPEGDSGDGGISWGILGPHPPTLP